MFPRNAPQEVQWRRDEGPVVLNSRLALYVGRAGRASFCETRERLSKRGRSGGVSGEAIFLRRTGWAPRSTGTTAQI